MSSTESIQGKVFENSSDARKHGKGGIWYIWKPETNRQFPQDVSSVMIVMPVNWGEPEIIEKGIICKWTVDHKNQCGAQWTLNGTSEKPTLSPSLHWVNMWHGYLQNGFLKSC